VVESTVSEAETALVSTELALRVRGCVRDREVAEPSTG
jgi:hypothetical protein